MFKRKQEEIEIVEGIFTDATDYNYYKMTINDMIIGFLIGFAGGFVAIQLFFSIIFISIPVAVGCGIYSIKIYKEKIIEKRKKRLLLQFRDLLDSLNNSMAAGDNVRDSFTNALEDMRSQHSENASITEETNIIVSGMYNNITIEELLENFAERSHLEDIQDFCNTFNTCLRLGGNLKLIVNDCRDVITQKIDIELEIKTIVASNKNQLNIVVIMPFALIGLMGMMGFEEVMAVNLTTIVVKVIALIAFGFSYKLGQKIVDIKV